MSTQSDFFNSVLSAVGAPVTVNNISILNHWASFEGNDYGSSRFNPLNTTQSAPGATVFNSAGVKNYPDYYTGVNATAKTLLNGRYNNIVAALRTNQPVEWWEKNPGIHSDLRTWGTVNFASWLEKQIPVYVPAVKKKFSFRSSLSLQE